MEPPLRIAHLAVLGSLTAALAGCSVRSMAVNALGSALAEGGSTYATDDDPELVGDAVPFGLKTIEALLQEAPKHEGLLFAATSGFVQYSYGWVQMRADFLEDQDLARATEQRDRARRLYIRARDYGLRGLEGDSPGIKDALARDPKAALARTRKEHAPLLYWTAAAWAGAMSLKINDSELSADQRIVEALARRALELDEAYDLGSIHDFFISWESGRSSIGGSIEQAKAHFDRAVALSRGRRASPYVTYAESVSVAQQNKAEFTEMLEKALAVDSSSPTDQRLANLLAQKRARWLLGRQEELFIE